MKFITLQTAAYVNGSLRHPHEGALHVTDEEGDRLIDEKVAVDVTADFSKKDNADAPVETISAPGADGAAEGETPSEQHQSEVAPQVTEAPKPARRKAAANKE